jgi:hypothetical protein
MGKQTNYSPTFPMFPAGAEAVTTNDSVNLSSPSVIYVGTSGNVQVTTANGDVVTFTGVPSGSVIPVQVIRVWATSTTALNMIRIY